MEGKCLRFTEKIQDYIFKLRIINYAKSEIFTDTTCVNGL